MSLNRKSIDTGSGAIVFDKYPLQENLYIFHVTADKKYNVVATVLLGCHAGVACEVITIWLYRNIFLTLSIHVAANDSKVLVV